MKNSILFAVMAGLGWMGIAHAKCRDGYFKDAQINYPCKGEFSRFDAIDDFHLNSIKSSCYGQEIFPEPSSKDGDTYKFKSEEGKKHVATITKVGDFVTFYFEVNPRRAFRFKKEGSKCYLDSFNVYSGSKKIIVSDSVCRAVLETDLERCAGKKKEADLTKVAKSKFDEKHGLEEEHLSGVIGNCRYHSCDIDKATKKRMPRFAASFLKPKSSSSAEQDESSKANKATKGQ